jgi:hypothetical protein
LSAHQAPGLEAFYGLLISGVLCEVQAVFQQHFVAPIHSLSLTSSISLTLFTLVYVIHLTCAFCRVSAFGLVFPSK